MDILGINDPANQDKTSPTWTGVLSLRFVWATLMRTDEGILLLPVASPIFHRYYRFATLITSSSGSLQRALLVRCRGIMYHLDQQAIAQPVSNPTTQLLRPFFGAEGNGDHGGQPLHGAEVQDLSK